ncbi:MAG TPA: hypothetical protein VNA44_09035 [Burkholderiaceae bacterium]|nr:hypothetical protein [Burkholderiaceae bacterium]
MVRGARSPNDAKGVLTDLRGNLKDASLTPAGYDYEDLSKAFREGLGELGGKVLGI